VILTGRNSFRAAGSRFTRIGPDGRTTVSNGQVFHAVLGAVIGSSLGTTGPVLKGVDDGERYEGAHNELSTNQRRRETQNLKIGPNVIRRLLCAPLLK
jgi:hypothetical protein